MPKANVPSTSEQTAGITRSGFLKGALGLLAGLFLRSKRARATTPDFRSVDASGRHRRMWGMVIDLDRCTGRRGCVVACRLENNVAVAGPGPEELQRPTFGMDMLATSVKERTHVEGHFIPTPCNHCEVPKCVKVCPVGATYINEEGIVAQIWARCIGCRYCTVACPYTRRYFNWYAPEWPETIKNTLNPDVATRPRGVVEKCTFCHHRLRKAKEQARREKRPLSDADVRHLPACAESCPARAITFGDLNDPEAEVFRLARSPRSFRLQEEVGTHPKVIYLRETKWKD